MMASYVKKGGSICIVVCKRYPCWLHAKHLYTDDRYNAGNLLLKSVLK